MTRDRDGVAISESTARFWIWVAIVGCSFATALVTYTITVTLAFASVRSDVSVLRAQWQDQTGELTRRVSAIEGKLGDIDALTQAVQDNTAAMAAIQQQNARPQRQNNVLDALRRKGVAQSDAKHR